MLWWTLWLFGFPRSGLALVATVGYDSAMIIETAAQLDHWCERQADGLLSALDPAAADHAVQCISSVIWRHAIGQGLRLGDDWAWILKMYGLDQFREIIDAAAESAAADRSRRRRR